MVNFYHVDKIPKRFKDNKPLENIFFNSIQRFDMSNFKQSDVLFVTEDKVDFYSKFNIKLVLMVTNPTFENFIEYYSKYSNQIKGYINFHANEIHFHQVVKVISEGYLWIMPNIKQEIDRRSNEKN